MIDLPLEGLVCVTVYILVTLLTPRILGRTALLITKPGAVIALWLVSLTTSLASLLLGTSLIITETLHRQAHGETMSNWGSSVTGSILTWLSLALLGVIAFRILASVGALRAERTAAINTIAPLLRGAMQTTYRGITVYEVASHELLIAAVPWINSIAISTELRARISPKLLEPALEHERAHLNRHHSTLVTIAALAVSAAGGIRASDRFAQDIRIAIELSADDIAAQEFGAHRVIESLATINPDSDAVRERIERLRRTQ